MRFLLPVPWLPVADPATTPAGQGTAPQLDEVMLAMDVVDTLRHQDTLVERELGQDARDEALKARLRQIYESQGLEVSDRILEQGIVALRESRFAYAPPPSSFNTFLARLWINRGPVGAFLAILLVLIVIVAGWQTWRSGEAAREAEALRIELTETLPADVRRAGDAAMAAATAADARAAVGRLVAEGEAAIADQDGDGMRAAVAELGSLRTEILRSYDLTIVSREGEDTGVFRVPDVNEDARNYYIIVEALTEKGERLALPIRHEESGEVETVSMWGVRVPESTFDAVRADKLDDGIVQNNVLGEKRSGVLAIEYLMDVESGTITRW